MTLPIAVLDQLARQEEEIAKLREEAKPGYWRNCHDIAEATNTALRKEIVKLREQRDRLIYTMLELMSDLESEIKARAEGELPRRIERDLAIIRHARAILAEIEKEVQRG